MIRDSKRELAPLTVGLVANVKKERTLRLRDQIRKRDRGSTKMQVSEFVLYINRMHIMSVCLSVCPSVEGVEMHIN